MKPKQKIDLLEPEQDIQPVQTFRVEEHEKIQQWTDTGFDMYAKGQVALLVMAGGQVLIFEST